MTFLYIMEFLQQNIYMMFEAIILFIWQLLCLKD
jgi:hypothetical protein